MKTSDWIMVAAIVLGPILSIVVSILLEKRRNIRQRKEYIFKTLMATRGTALHPSHVEALNMIDVEFTDKKSQIVVEEWRTYLDHLGSGPQERSSPDFQVLHTQWASKNNEYLTNLLFQMAKYLGYKFDKLTLKNGFYSPKGHGDAEVEQQFIRKSIVALFTKKQTLPVTVTDLLNHEYRSPDDNNIVTRNSGSSSESK